MHQDAIKKMDKFFRGEKQGQVEAKRICTLRFSICYTQVYQVCFSLQSDLSNGSRGYEMVSKRPSWWQNIPKPLLVVGARSHSLWRQIKQHLVTILVVAIILVGAIALIIIGYRFDWTGFNGNNKSGKTLWDWLQLLIVPLVLAIGGFSLSQMQKTIEQRRTTDNQREAALQAYIDKMSELLLTNHLRDLAEDKEVQKIARVRTLTVLLRLDAERKGSVLQFLYESDLIKKDKSFIGFLYRADLSGANLYKAILFEADLSRANLNNAYLFGADLSNANLTSGAKLIEVNLSNASLFGADLSGADLSGADLSNANLSNAILFGANLSNANLSNASLFGTNLSEAILSNASVTSEQLDKALSLKNTTLPDGSKHL
jgi:uncharacterized protein YjbI with pentapeptide repeats